MCKCLKHCTSIKDIKGLSELYSTKSKQDERVRMEGKILSEYYDFTIKDLKTRFNFDVYVPCHLGNSYRDTLTSILTEDSNGLYFTSNNPFILGQLKLMNILFCFYYFIVDQNKRHPDKKEGFILECSDCCCNHKLKPNLKGKIKHCACCGTPVFVRDNDENTDDYPDVYAMFEISKDGNEESTSPHSHCEEDCCSNSEEKPKKVKLINLTQKIYGKDESDKNDDGEECFISETTRRNLCTFLKNMNAQQKYLVEHREEVLKERPDMKDYIDFITPCFQSDELREKQMSEERMEEEEKEDLSSGDSEKISKENSSSTVSSETEVTIRIIERPNKKKSKSPKSKTEEGNQSDSSTNSSTLSISQGSDKKPSSKEKESNLKIEPTQEEINALEQGHIGFYGLEPEINRLFFCKKLTGPVKIIKNNKEVVDCGGRGITQYEIDHDLISEDVIYHKTMNEINCVFKEVFKDSFSYFWLLEIMGKPNNHFMSYFNLAVDFTFEKINEAINVYVMKKAEKFPQYDIPLPKFSFNFEDVITYLSDSEKYLRVLQETEKSEVSRYDYFRAFCLSKVQDLPIDPMNLKILDKILKKCNLTPITTWKTDPETILKVADKERSLLKEKNTRLKKDLRNEQTKTKQLTKKIDEVTDKKNKEISSLKEQISALKQEIEKLKEKEKFYDEFKEEMAETKKVLKRIKYRDLCNNYIEYFCHLLDGDDEQLCLGEFQRIKSVGKYIKDNFKKMDSEFSIEDTLIGIKKFKDTFNSIAHSYDEDINPNEFAEEVDEFIKEYLEKEKDQKEIIIAANINQLDYKAAILKILLKFHDLKMFVFDRQHHETIEEGTIDEYFRKIYSSMLR
ncbi:MAG: hypothetical protein MJ252_14025 [archaeon]|nr:hypothetical protein [archaeon]